MISAMQSALSGLQSFGVKMQSSANNIANSSTNGYKRTQVNFANMDPNGVKAEVTRSTHSGPMVYEGTTQGMELIEQSNVDLGQEMVDMITTSHAYDANLKSIVTADRMLQSVLDLKA